MGLIKRIISIWRRLIYSPEKYARYLGVNIGKNNLIGYHHWSTEPYLITIGSNCQLTNCKIHTHGGGGSIRYLYPEFDVFGKVVIGDWCYIGYNSQIMPGVTIGNGALIAAGSIVTKSVTAHTVVAGNPAKFICTVDEYIERNLKYNVNSKHMSSKEKRNFLLSLSDDNFLKK